ncbi:MAG: DUF2924 domain-containing protein [Casimicrobiaceae bacterium]
MSDVASDATSDTLAALAALDRRALAERWAAVFGCPAPRHAQATLLRAALAWHAQMQPLGADGSGGVDRLVRGVRRAAAASVPTTVLAPGTRLLREWQGHTHHVTVLTQGFEYGGETYRSLTAIARHITGTPWSGPRFFGLRP